MIFHFLHFSYIKSLVSNMAYKGMIYQSALVRDARKGFVSLVKIIPFLQKKPDIGRNGASSIPRWHHKQTAIEVILLRFVLVLR